MVSYIGEVLAHSVALMGLNPYCSGQWSRTYVEINTYYDENVLILIVVDNGLVQMTSRMIKYGLNGLNPYCSGQWSRTQVRDTEMYKVTES